MQVRFIGKKEELPGVFSLSFAPLEPLSWIAGQSVRLEVPGFYGPEERRFTISAAPYEKNLAITTRLAKSSFKQSLANLQTGDIVNAYDISGDFTWAKTSLKRLFVASGIGITPFFSILKQRVHDDQPIPVTLLHASRDLVDLFASELEAWQALRSEFALQRFRGQRMTGELIAGHIPGLDKYVVYLSGPSEMVDEVGCQLVQHEGLPEAQLKKDWFTGRLGRDD